MSLADSISKIERKGLTFPQWLDSLPESDRKKLFEAAVDPTIPHTPLHATVRSWGARVAKETFTKWRYDLGLPR